jgi:serine/threonine transporter
MIKILKKLNGKSLVFRIIIGLTLGLFAGLIFPSVEAFSLPGTLFVSSLKAIAPVLVLILVVSSLACAQANPGKKFITVIVLYILSTLLASVTAVVGSFLFPVSLKLTDAYVSEGGPVEIKTVIYSLLGKVVENPINSLVESNFIGILAWSILFGIALKKIAIPSTKQNLSDLSESVTTVVQWIINLAPIGIFGLVFEAVSANGLRIFSDYGKLLALLIGCMVVMALLIDPFIIFLCIHKNPYPLVFRCLKECGITAFFTRSSAANIPVNMAFCEKLGLDKDVYSVSIPLGATINMNGAAITITVMTLAAANTLGLHVDLITALLLSVLSAVAACGASGVTGGSLLLIPLACSLFGIPNDIAMQVVGVGFIIGVVQDSFETAVNSSGDAMFAATAEFREWKKEGKPIQY